MSNLFAYDVPPRLDMTPLMTLVNLRNIYNMNYHIFSFKINSFVCTYDIEHDVECRSVAYI